MRFSRATLPRWLFSPDSDHWLTLLRVGLGAQVVLYCLTLRHAWSSLLSGSGAGLLDRRLPEFIIATQSGIVPQVHWLTLAMRPLGWSEQTTLHLMWSTLLAAGLLLIGGLFCRASAVLAWFLHLAAAKSGGLFAYGVDNFMTIGLFYLMLAPLPDSHSLDARFWKRRPLDPALLGFFRRILQLHLCVVYFFSGLTKSLGSGWWNGSALWRALTRPQYELIPADWLASFSDLLIPAGIAVCVIELAYPVFIWRARTRRVWLLLICAIHATIGIAMGMYLFALIMIVLNVAAFGPPVPLTTVSVASRAEAA